MVNRFLVFQTFIIKMEFLDLSKSNYLGPIEDTSPANSKDYGRFKKPLSTIDFSWVSPALCTYVTRKHWNFVSVSTPNYLIVRDATVTITGHRLTILKR
jgi:hypothetical protein